MFCSFTEYIFCYKALNLTIHLTSFVMEFILHFPWNCWKIVVWIEPYIDLATSNEVHIYSIIVFPIINEILRYVTIYYVKSLYLIIWKQNTVSYNIMHTCRCVHLSSGLLFLEQCVYLIFYVVNIYKTATWIYMTTSWILYLKDSVCFIFCSYKTPIANLMNKKMLKLQNTPCQFDQEKAEAQYFTTKLYYLRIKYALPFKFEKRSI